MARKNINCIIIHGCPSDAEKAMNPETRTHDKHWMPWIIDETIKNRVQKIVMFTADDEEKDGKKSLQIYHQSLGGEVIELKGRGHYTMRDMGTTEFPELLEAILQ